MWPYPNIVAHRGGGTLAPENTIAALRCGLAYGFRAVEFDVMLAADGVPVVMHDPELGRTVAGSGNVNDHSAEQLARMDAGSWFGPAFAGEPVPDFASVVAYCREQRIWMNIEIKPAPGCETETGRVVASATRSLFADQLEQGAGNPAVLPLLSSFSVEALAVARDVAPDLPRAWLVDQVPADWRAVLDELGAVALHTNQRFLTAELAGAIKQAGFGLFCYTVNVPERGRELLAWGVDAFCTDRIDLISPTFA
jgi:glycerophosphoryl diester phosphodiesterase